MAVGGRWLEVAGNGRRRDGMDERRKSNKCGEIMGSELFLEIGLVT